MSSPRMQPACVSEQDDARDWLDVKDILALLDLIHFSWHSLASQPLLLR
jgi:hypothetical protein